MRLRTQLVLLTAVSTLPFLVALPWALHRVQREFEQELDQRLERAGTAVRSGLTDLGVQVERAVRDLAADPAVEEVAQAVHAGDFERVRAPVGERLMALSGLDALELLDSEGRIFASGHLPGRAGDPDLPALELARQQPGKAAWVRLETRTENGIAPALALVAARPVDYGGVRIYVVGGRLLGGAWAQRVSELTGAAIAVRDGEGELARSRPVSQPRALELPLRERSGPAGAAVRVELSDAPLRQMKATIVRSATGLWLVLLAAAMALGLLLAGRIARPVDALAKGARAIAGGELGRKVEARASGELRELVEAFNAMSGDLKSVTERAAAAERLAAWQGVARRLAHEIKNPLTPIRMSIETLLAAHRARRQDFDEIFNESARAVLEEVERLRRIVDEFSRFARLPKPQLAPAELSEVVGSVLALYSEPRPGVRLERQLEPGLPVCIDSDQIAQVLINLLANADQAMPGGGAIRVRTASERDWAFLEVEDEGPGIAPEMRSHLFEPYFTTKEGGTGLGLAIAQRIAQEHGGRLDEVGEPGRGARFRLTLPRRADPGPPAS